MHLTLRNPFRKTRKKHCRTARQPKQLLSSGERKRMSYLKKLLAKENEAADVKLGKSLKNSFEKFLSSKKKSGSKKTKTKTKTKKKRKRKGKGKRASK
jgi:hypothetical protein